MSVTFRPYSGPAGITGEYFRLRAFFLQRRGDDFPFGRWDWMITHGWLDREAVGRIGVWETGGAVGRGDLRHPAQRLSCPARIRGAEGRCCARPTALRRTASSACWS